MIERFGYQGYLIAPASLVEAHAMHWLAERAAQADNDRDSIPTA